MVQTDQQLVIGAVATVLTVALSSTLILNVSKKAYHTWRLRRLAAAASAQSGGSDADATITVTGLFIHPVKSMRAVSLQEAELDHKGLSDDRRFMVAYEAPLPPYKEAWEEHDVTHRFMSQRVCPSLATVVATLVESRLVLVHDAAAPGEQGGAGAAAAAKARIEIPLPTPTPGPGGTPARSFLAGIWDDKVLVHDLGDEAAAFVQAIVDADEACTATGKVRLVCHSTNDRAADHKFTPSYAKSWWGSAPLVSLTDGFPILIASEASLRAVNERLRADGVGGGDGPTSTASIPMDRFRPNIVIAGDGLEPFEEDYWKVIAIGDVLFAIVKGCPRCKQSCTDQTTGQVFEQPVKVMKSFRVVGNDSDDVYFAQNAIPLLGMMSGAGGGGSGNRKGPTGLPCIRVGDPVRVLERGDPIFNAWESEE